MLLTSSFPLLPIVHTFFAFLLLYLCAAAWTFGWGRTAVFTFLPWSLAFVVECSSTRNGVPFGLYTYLELTRERGPWIANFPFMDSLFNRVVSQKMGEMTC